METKGMKYVSPPTIRIVEPFILYITQKHNKFSGASFYRSKSDSTVKKYLHLVYLLLCSLLLLTNFSCRKGVKEAITLDKAAGKWSINAIRYRIYYGTPEPKDSTVPWKPVVENFVSFDGVSHFQYCYNSSATTGGEYAFVGSDSIDIKIGTEINRWKIQLLTSTNFNIERTSSDNNSFPGATVITYQGFVR